MDSFLALPDVRQRTYYEEGQNLIGLLPTIIEKDFWVCWTLRELFRLPGWEQHLTFKGGTSLSKGWGLISRFSEDIDLVISRDHLGFSSESLSGKQLKKLKKKWTRLLPAMWRTGFLTRPRKAAPNG